MDCSNYPLLILLFISLLFLGKYFQNEERFENQEPTEGNPFGCTLGMNRYKTVADGECCDVQPVGRIIPATCNRIPNFPLGLTPTSDIPDDAKMPEAPFDQLTTREGKYTFVIPELKYDGIWSQKVDGNKCCWTMENTEKIKTYGANKLSPNPPTLFGKTIIEPPECAGLWPPYKPPITYIYNCHEDIPCSRKRNIPCPTRV